MAEMEKKVALKNETRQFLGDLRTLVERSCVDVTNIRLARMFQKLWEVTGRTLRECPAEASRLVKRWAKGKLSSATSFDALMTNDIMQPSGSDDHYARRGSLLIQLVVLRLFADASEAFFENGPDIFPTYATALDKLRPASHQDKVSNSSQSQSNFGSPLQDDDDDDEEMLFNQTEDDFELRVPLRSSFSQGSFSLTQKSTNNKYIATAEEDPFTRQNSSWSVGGRPADVKASPKWPVTSLRVEDPITNITDVVMWLRLATVALDFTSSHSDCLEEHQQPGKKRKAIQKVYPFEKVLSEGISAPFSFVFPRTLESIYRELEISPQSSEPLAAALSLRKLIDNDHEVWGSRTGLLGAPPQSPLTPLTPISTEFNVSSMPIVSHTKKRRKKKEAAASAMDTRDSLALELEKIHERKKIKAPSLASRQPGSKIACR
eukprot:TRINITY_DN20502_c0_g1_i1.p1 TRINITY_DN20502_c0_g1~~TRINITY_DN20502_c0_g1_i1.p1  ORF type:complete len:433 (+),score=91.81 TRINITY_DN20502_c0_g1_i1:33-1331(+)